MMCYIHTKFETMHLYFIEVIKAKQQIAAPKHKCFGPSVLFKVESRAGRLGLMCFTPCNGNFLKILETSLLFGDTTAMEA